ncbi:MAG: helix-turn-helix transcriptional regulator [Candidatus Paceibacterota bacterium]
MKLIPFEKIKKEALKDSEFREAYEELEPEFEIVCSVIRKRQEKGLSQKELAQRAGTGQSAISRLESGTYNPSLAFLKKVSKALDAKLEVKLK